MTPPRPGPQASHPGRPALPARSPDADALLRVEPHPVVGSGAEHLVELVEVAGDVGAELRRAVRVRGEVLHRQLLPALGAPAVGPVEEEPTPVVDGGVATPADDVRLVPDREPPEVTDVLADGERAVDVLAG